MRCEVCGRLPMNPLIHHIDGNHINNNLGNLKILCYECHSVIHNGFGKVNSRNKNYKTSNKNIKYNSKGVGYTPKILITDLLIKNELMNLRNIWLKLKEEKQNGK